MLCSNKSGLQGIRDKLKNEHNFLCVWGCLYVGKKRDLWLKQHRSIMVSIQYVSLEVRILLTGHATSFPKAWNLSFSFQFWEVLFLFRNIYSKKYLPNFFWVSCLDKGRLITRPKPTYNFGWWEAKNKTPLRFFFFLYFRKPSKHLTFSAFVVFYFILIVFLFLFYILQVQLLRFLFWNLTANLRRSR